MSLFQKSVINKYLKNLDNDKVNIAFENFKKFYGNKLRLHNIMQLKEENYQEGFLREIFVETLGYTINPDENYNLTTEYKNQKDARKADGAILLENKAIGVIELKSTKTKNLESIKEQAFSYKNNQPGCRYVITSNFQSLRFYVDDATEYEEFNLFELANDTKTDGLTRQFKLFYLLLSKESIFSNLPDKLKKETKFHENDISDKLYKDYKHFKGSIFESLVKNNPQYDKLTLFKKSQKLLDRFLFVLFAEDGGLIPPNAISKIIEQWKQLQELDEYKPLYSRFQKLFSHLDKGHIYKGWGEIPAYNGGLFREDEILDSPGLKIDDDVLLNDSQKLTAYDFNTEVDVNILGHIFEHSISEIEEMEKNLSASESHDSVELSKPKTSKRKKDGIFYTPKYITKYIVENTVGALCKEKKEELQINDLLIDDTYRKKDGKLTAKAKKLFTVLEEYKKWMLGLKVLDPACGSGAFLNQTLDFLIAENKQADDIITELTGESIRLFDTDKAILENNIYGVDINEESVEIAKLSLWLRTAQRGRPLSDLSGNIKCGNSLIDDPEVAGEKAFNWNIEFKEIMDNGGFDVVIGNPPYGAFINDIHKKYYKSKFITFQGNFEIYFFFIELINTIISKTGFLGFITPDTWINIPQAQKLRVHTLANYNVSTIVNFDYPVFPDAAVNPIVFILSKIDKILTCKVNIIYNESQITKLNKKESFLTCLVSEWRKSDDNQFQIFQSQEELEIIHKIKNCSDEAINILDVSQGIVSYSKEHLSEEDIKKRIYHSNIKNSEEYGMWVQGRAIKRYSINTTNHEFLRYGKWLHRPRKAEYFNNERILIQEITGGNPPRITASYYKELLYHDPGIISCLNKTSINTKFLLTIINSNLISWVNRLSSPKGKRNTFPKVLIGDIRKLPIKTTQEEQPFIEKADQMLSLNKELQTKSQKFIKRIKANLEVEKITNKLQNFYDFDFKTFIAELKKQKIKLSLQQQDEWEDYFDNYKQEINKLQQQINQTDKKIDKMVYELYELTEEEIEIVEKSTK